MRHAPSAAESRPALHDRYRSATTRHAAGSRGFSPPIRRKSHSLHERLYIHASSQSDNCPHTRQIVLGDSRRENGHHRNRLVIYSRGRRPGEAEREREREVRRRTETATKSTHGRGPRIFDCARVAQVEVRAERGKEGWRRAHSTASTDAHERSSQPSE